MAQQGSNANLPEFRRLRPLTPGPNPFRFSIPDRMVPGRMETVPSVAVDNGQMNSMHSEDDLDISSVQDTCPEVSCPVCLEFFHDPKMLNCGHSVCNLCVQKLVETTRTMVLFQQTGVSRVLCPQCRTPTVVPSEGLPTNFGLKELLAKFKAMETGEHSKSGSSRSQLCTACQATQPLEQFWHCEECPEKEMAAARGPQWFCSTCAVRYHNGHGLTAYAAMKERTQRELLAIGRSRDDCEQNIQQGRSFGGTLNEVVQDIFHALGEKANQGFDHIQRDLMRKDGMCTNGELTNAVAKRTKLKNNVKDICQQVDNCQRTALENLQQCLNDVLRLQLVEESEETGMDSSGDVVIIDEGSPLPNKRHFSPTIHRSRGYADIQIDISSPTGPCSRRPIAIPKRRVKVKSRMRGDREPSSSYGYRDSESPPFAPDSTGDSGN